jgi:ribosomal-protein-alanine N-acetyltransferase
VATVAGEVILTDRLEIRPLGLAGMRAMIERGAKAFAQIFNTDPSVPITPPPELADVLPMIAEEVRADPTAAPWWTWILIRRSDRAVIGSVGFGGRPDADGTVITGYSVYPAFEGHGYATEATRAAVEWVLRQEGVQRVQATVPPWHGASLRVVEKAGFLHVGESEDPEVGPVLVWEIARP